MDTLKPIAETDSILSEAKRYGDCLHIDLSYPRGAGHVKAIQVGLMDVRAADSIQVSYDFERDGWVIKRQFYIEHDEWMEPVGDWQEAAFIQAWASPKPDRVTT